MNNDTKTVASGDRLSKPTAIVFPDFLRVERNLRNHFSSVSLFFRRGELILQKINKVVSEVMQRVGAK